MDSLLNNEELTLEQLLDSDLELLSELRNQNKALIEYFSPKVLSKLLTYVLIEPLTDDLKQGHKYPFVCNEIISCEVPQILDHFFSEQGLLDQLFSFLNERQVNLTLAGYFSSIASILLRHNSYELLSYIHEMMDIGKVLVDHLYSTSIMNFVWKLMADEDHGNPAYVAKLDEMVEFVLAGYCETGRVGFYMQIVNSANMVSGLLRNHGETTNWTYVQQAVSFSPNADILINCSLGGNQVLAEASLCIIEAYLCNLDVRNSEDNIVSNEISYLLELLCEKVPKYCEILKMPNNTLGMTRLNIIKILTSLMRLTFIEVKQAIKLNNFPGVLMDLIPLHPWNSFLHNIVCETITNILLGEDSEIKELTIHKSSLIQVLIESSKLERNTVGYLGMVSKIANVLIKTTGNDLNEIEGWKNFVSSFVAEKNKAESLVLGQGLFKINSNLDLPEVDEDEFFDAIEGPEDYIVPLKSPEINQIVELPKILTESNEIVGDKEQKNLIIEEETKETGQNSEEIIKNETNTLDFPSLQDDSLIEN